MYREQEGVGSEIGEIRQILQRGLEVVRCIDNHGLHPCILVHLARIFNHRVSVGSQRRIITLTKIVVNLIVIISGENIQREKRRTQ